MTTQPIKGKLSKKAQYHTTEWKAFRTAVFVRDNYTCVKCGAVGVELNAHHLRYAIGKMLWEVPMDWCITVCVPCHSKIHNKRMGKKVKNKTTSVLDFM